MDFLKFLTGLTSLQHKWILFQGTLANHEAEALRYELKKNGYEFHRADIRSDGPTADLEADFAGIYFFSARKAYIVSCASNPKSWSDSALALWTRITSLSDPASTWLFVESEFNLPEASSKPLTFEVAKNAEALPWIKYWNTWNKPTLDEARLNFLAGQETEDFSLRSSWLELWKVGDDEWATHVLGWDASAPAQPRALGNTEVRDPAYAWVDAALRRDQKNYMTLTRQLIQDRGEDPIRLWALLGKSIKILSQLHLGEEPVGEPPFLINKLKRVRFDSSLLTRWCERDLAMKSSRADVLSQLENF